MEFSLLPFHRGQPSIPVPKTPYIARERYDGGPWVSYPSRCGVALSAWDGERFDIQEYHRSEANHPTALGHLESFVQTWLYFGLLSECQCIGMPANEDDTSSIGKRLAATIVDDIYKATVVQTGDLQFVQLSPETLTAFLSVTQARLRPDPAGRIQFYEHLQLCLSCTRSMLGVLPSEFNHEVKCSIAALGELLMQTVNTAFQMRGLKNNFGRFWGKNFLDEAAKRSMKDHGWCKSDIARLEAKYKSVQSLYIARMMDKSLPKRNHEKCTEFACRLFQIKAETFQLQHQQENCLCSQLEVDSEELTAILLQDNKFPVLRFTGDLQNLKAELVKEEAEVPYVAISHVWADGLGNPESNSLHRCKLLHLANLVRSMPDDEAKDGDSVPCIWLDTLCSPAKDGPGKQRAIEKIRLVYERAKAVLVLDAGLMSYSAKEQSVFELLLRIFTSGWMRRLWTLQEGALAKSLFFQFADKALSLDDLMKSLFQNSYKMTYKAIIFDFWTEQQGLRSFFHLRQDETRGNTDIATLDLSLQFRSVSVPSDEPLCIGTLLGLNLNHILSVEGKSDRMLQVWKLITAKKHGVPMQVIFFQEPGIDTPGWRWAPRSFLEWTSGNHDMMNTRNLKWNDSRLGGQTDRGLRVQYPGYRITKSPESGKRALLGFPRRPEFNVFFRDRHTGEWYRIFDKEHGYRNLVWTKEERQAYYQLELHPLHDIAETSDSGLVLNVSADKSTGANHAYVTRINEALFGAIVPAQTSTSPDEGLAVRKGRIVFASPAKGQDGYMYDTLRRLASDLRADELVEKHEEIYQRIAEAHTGSPDLLKAATENSEEMQTSIKQLREKMRSLVADTAAADDRFVKAVGESGEVTLENVWVWIYDFVVYDYVGEKRDADQVWFID